MYGSIYVGRMSKSVSSPKTLETFKKVRGGTRPRDPCGKRPTPNRLSYEGGWQILGTNTEYRKLMITDRNWDRCGLSRPSTICRRMSQGEDMKCTSPKNRDSLPMLTRTWWQGMMMNKFQMHHINVKKYCRIRSSKTNKLWQATFIWKKRTTSLREET